MLKMCTNANNKPDDTTLNCPMPKLEGFLRNLAAMDGSRIGDAFFLSPYSLVEAKYNEGYNAMVANHREHVNKCFEVTKLKLQI